MKKKSILFIILISVIFFGGNVSASTNFEIVNDISTAYSDFKEVKLSQVLKVDNGYIIYDNSNGSENPILKLIDFDGNEIWTKSFYGPGNRSTNVSMMIIDESYFIIASAELGVLKVSIEDGSIVNSLSISYNENYTIQIVSYQDNYAVMYSSNSYSYVTIFNEKFEILNTTTISNNTYAITSNDNYIYILTAYSSTYEILTIDSSYTETYLEITSSSSSLYSNGILVIFENDLYYINDDLVKISCTSTECSVNIISDSYETNYYYNSASIYEDYLIIGGIYNDEYGFIQIYDTDFNLVQSITIDDGDESAVKSITATADGFVVKGIYYDTNDGYKYIKEYVPVYNITTKTDGNGTIEVSSETAYYSDLITFTITAKSGYTLSTLTLTASDGTSVTYELSDETYTFTVSQDTVIEATFSEIVEDVVEVDTTTTEQITEEVEETNPNTGSFIPLVLIPMAVIGITFINKKQIISKI